MYSERCPECDIELISADGGNRWTCPLCNQVPRPEQYIRSKVKKLPITTPARDELTKTMELLAEAVDEMPQYAEVFSRIYHQISRQVEELDNG